MALCPTTLRNLSLLYRNSSRVRYNSTSSVNPTEISHFNALASSWWDPHGSSRLLHLMNPLRHDFISACHSSQSEALPSRGMRYLDIGCGGGIFAESAARLISTERVTAIDPSSEVIAVAKMHARHDALLMEPERLQYLNKSIEALSLPSTREDQFDVVTLFEVIEHISRPAPFLTSCLPFVKPGGWLVLSTIARTWTSWLTTSIVAEDLVRLVPKGTHDWNKYINEQELREFFRAHKGWGGQGGIRAMGCMYIPGLGWKTVAGAENWGNYFFAIRKNVVP